MNKIRITAEERRTWVKRWRESGQPAKDFARENQLSISTLYAWARPPKPKGDAVAAFVPLTTPVLSETSRRAKNPFVEIQLQDGVLLRVEPNIELPRLQDIVRALKTC